MHGRCGELAALSALRDVFGLREIPDIGPARLPVKSTSPLSRTRYLLSRYRREPLMDPVRTAPA